LQASSGNNFGMVRPFDKLRAPQAHQPLSASGIIFSGNCLMMKDALTKEQLIVLKTKILFLKKNSILRKILTKICIQPN
jgi:hypothetical protein